MFLNSYGTLVGRLIIQKGMDSFTEVSSSFDTIFTATATADHGELAGLTDDDHDGLYYTETEVDTKDSAQDECSEITGCVENAITNHTRNTTASDLSCSDCITGVEIAELTDADISNTLTCSILTDDDTYALTGSAETFDELVTFTKNITGTNINANAFYDNGVLLTADTDTDTRHTMNTSQFLLNVTIKDEYVEGLCYNTEAELTTLLDDAYIELGDTFGGEVSGTYGAIVIGHDVLDDQYYDSEADLTGLLDNNYQPLEATLTDIADGIITENLVNTANTWADNEVSNTLTCSILTDDDTYALTGSAETFDENVAFAKNITQGDNDAHCFGNSNDACIYWNGTALIIE